MYHLSDPKDSEGNVASMVWKREKASGVVGSRGMGTASVVGADIFLFVVFKMMRFLK